jgi:hypothetical protein
LLLLRRDGVNALAAMFAKDVPAFDAAAAVACLSICLSARRLLMSIWVFLLLPSPGSETD